MKRTDERRGIIRLNNSEGKESRNKEYIEKFYGELYRSRTKNPKNGKNERSKEIPEITEDELLYALTSIKSNNAPGTNKIIIEMINQALEILIPRLQRKCVEEENIPEKWHKTSTVFALQTADKSRIQ